MKVSVRFFCTRYNVRARASKVISYRVCIEFLEGLISVQQRFAEIVTPNFLGL